MDGLQHPQPLLLGQYLGYWTWETVFVGGVLFVILISVRNTSRKGLHFRCKADHDTPSMNWLACFLSHGTISGNEKYSHEGWFRGLFHMVA